MMKLVSLTNRRSKVFTFHYKNWNSCSFCHNILISHLMTTGEIIFLKLPCLQLLNILIFNKHFSAGELTKLTRERLIPEFQEDPDEMVLEIIKDHRWSPTEKSKRKHFFPKTGMKIIMKHEKSLSAKNNFYNFQIFHYFPKRY